jgi:hypothetical protein
MITRCLSRIARSVAFLVASIIAASSVAIAQTVPTTSVSATPPAMISGTVRSASGAPIAGASVQISGPTTTQTTTDAKGGFAVSVPPGVYSVTVRKGGFNPATLADLTVVPGTSAPLNVSLAPVDLSSLQTIGSTTSTSRTGRSAINLGAASQDTLSGQQFADQAAPQVNDVLQRLPDVTLQHMGDDPDTTIVVGGAQPYETQVLIDGHPLALGQYGAWTSQYFPSYLVGSVETQSGPGNTTPFANIAVGGTVNFLTPGFTAKPSAELTAGVDTFWSQYTNLLATDTVGNLSYVVGLGAAGLNGPYFQSKHCDVSASAPNLPGNEGIVEFCGDASGSLLTRPPPRSKRASSVRGAPSRRKARRGEPPTGRPISSTALQARCNARIPPTPTWSARRSTATRGTRARSSTTTRRSSTRSSARRSGTTHSSSVRTSA